MDGLHVFGWESVLEGWLDTDLKRGRERPYYTEAFHAQLTSGLKRTHIQARSDPEQSRNG